MKIIVDKASCIGCGACVAIDNADFKFDENGISETINPEVKEVSENLSEAIASCPVNAIKLEECNCGDHCDCGSHCNCNH